MATCSLIGIKNPNWSVNYIRCNNDGCPQYVGRILTECYPTIVQVFDLLNIGDISTLGTTTRRIKLGVPNPEDHWRPEFRQYTESYAVTHGWEPRNMVAGSLDAYVQNGSDMSVEYLYLYDPEHCAWFVYDMTDPTDWRDVLDILDTAGDEDTE